MDSTGNSFEDSTQKDWGRKAILPLVPNDSDGEDCDLSGRDADEETREDVSAMRTICMGSNLLLFRVCSSLTLLFCDTFFPCLAQVATFLDKSDFQDYISDEGWWATQVETTTSCGEPLSMVTSTRNVDLERVVISSLVCPGVITSVITSVINNVINNAINRVVNSIFHMYLVLRRSTL